MKTARSTLLLLIFLSVFAREAFSQSTGKPLEEMRNFHRISSELLTAGQLNAEHIPALKSGDVELVINLAVADPERNASEGFLVSEQGVSYMQIPVIWDAPTTADLDLFFSMMDARGERTTLVHCFANYRASAFTYLYRVLREGVAEDVARKDLMAVWDDEAFARAPQWQKFIDDVLKERL